MRRWAQPIAAEQCRIELTRLGEDAALFGAARLAFLERRPVTKPGAAMSAIAYHDAITKVLDDIRRTQIGKIQQAGEAIADLDRLRRASPGSSGAATPSSP